MCCRAQSRGVPGRADGERGVRQHLGNQPLQEGQNSEVRPRRRSETERYSATDLVKRVTVGVDRMMAPTLSMSRCLNSTDVIKGLQQEDHTGVLLEGRQEGENRREVWDATPSTLKREEEAANRGVRLAASVRQLETAGERTVPEGRSGTSPAGTQTSAQWNPLWTPDLHGYGAAGPCRFKPLNLW